MILLGPSNSPPPDNTSDKPSEGRQRALVSAVNYRVCPGSKGAATSFGDLSKDFEMGGFPGNFSCSPRLMR